MARHELATNPKIAAELCVLFLIMAAQCFEDIPEEETPGPLIKLLEARCPSGFVLAPGRLWIEEITKAYQEAAEADDG